MQRFKKYIGKDVKVESMKNEDQIKNFGINCRYVPGQLEEFGEFEYTADFDGQDVVICVAVLLGKLKRIMFVLADKADQDNVKPLTEAQLNDFLNQKGEHLVNFFEYITQP